MIYINPDHRRTGALLSILTVTLLGSMVYLPWEDPSSCTHYRFLWDSPVVGGHLDLSVLVCNVAIVTAILFGIEWIAQTCETLIRWARIGSREDSLRVEPEKNGLAHVLDRGALR